MVAAQKDQRRGPSSPPTVLVVEDVPLARMLVAGHLRASGFAVVEASNGDEAVRVLQAGVPVDVVLSDVYVPAPAMDGPALARWIHAHRPELKVLLGSGVVSDIDPALSGFYEEPMLSKPYKHEELERRLRDAIAEDPGESE